MQTLRKRAAALVLLCLLLQLPPASANVYTTEEESGGTDSLYVAGDPAGYPVEYYDASVRSYRGAVPALLDYLSGKTGLNFTYIRTGLTDRREELSANAQVELFFAAEGDSLLENAVQTVPWGSVARSGAETQLYCCFTAAAREEDVQAISQAIGEMRDSDRVGLFYTSAETASPLRLLTQPVFLLCCAAALALLLLVLLVFLLRRRKRKKNAGLSSPAAGIGTREYFAMQFGNFINDPVRELYYIVYYSFDIDWAIRFYGNEEADRMLSDAAERLREQMGDNDFCARVGGVAFCAAIQRVNREQAEQAVAGTLESLNAYGRRNHGGEEKIAFRAGVYALQTGDRDWETALGNAEEAYHAAVRQKEDWVFATPDLLESKRRRSSVRDQISDSLDIREFVPYIQFIISADDLQICGAELLSRWQNKTHGLLDPSAYISDILELGHILELDLEMLENACKLLERWNSEGKPYFLTCNLSRSTISNDDVLEPIMETIQRYSFPHGRLILEVTEDTLEEHKEHALACMTRLKEEGFRVALDKFGSGVTTVANLCEYPVDLLKLDHQLVGRASEDEPAERLLRELVVLAGSLGMEVLAEGVENERMDHVVRAAGCDYIQGYCYAKPIPVRDADWFSDSVHKSLAAALPTEAVRAAAAKERTACIEKKEPDEELLLPDAGPLPEAAPDTEPECVPVPAAEDEPENTPANEADGGPESDKIVHLPLPDAPADPVTDAAADAPDDTVVDAAADSAADAAAGTAADWPAVPAEPLSDPAAAEEKPQAPCGDAAAALPADSEPDSQTPMLHIRLGAYSLDLPPDIDTYALAVIVRSIQKKMQDD